MAAPLFVKAKKNRAGKLLNVEHVEDREKAQRLIVKLLNRAEIDVRELRRVVALDVVLALREYEEKGDPQSAKYVADAHRMAVEILIGPVPEVADADDGWDALLAGKPVPLAGLPAACQPPEELRMTEPVEIVDADPAPPPPEPPPTPVRVSKPDRVAPPEPEPEVLPAVVAARARRRPGGKMNGVVTMTSRRIEAEALVTGGGVKTPAALIRRVLRLLAEGTSMKDVSLMVGVREMQLRTWERLYVTMRLPVPPLPDEEEDEAATG